MIRLLKAVADWLDRRFPAKITMTEETWNAMNRRIELLEMKTTNRVQEFNIANKINEIEQSIAILKKKKEEARTVMNPKQAFIETGNIALIK